jgi:flagellar biosynthesis protein FliQ
MQDLGKITIDINEGGGSSGGGAASSDKIQLEDFMPSKSDFAVGMGASLFGPVATAVAIALKKVTEYLIAAAIKIYEAFMKLREWVLKFADDIRQYSPELMLADLNNELQMMITKMGAAQMGGRLTAGVVAQEGRVERSLFRMQAYLSTVSAAVVGPIMKAVANILEYLESWIPKIIDAIGAMIEALGLTIQAMSDILPAGYGGNFFKSLGKEIEKIGNDVRQVKMNTAPAVNFGDINKPFINDLRLMGATI